MRRFFAIPLILAVSALGWAELVSAEQPPPAGARGVCVTEMDGGERVEIPVTVLGTLAPAAPEGEVVLVRLDDPRFERTGIIAGMSGSPVYVDGKLVGALAYGWPFSREPIGGVTPWTRMESIGGGASASVPGARPSFAELAEDWNGPHPGTRLLDWLVPEPARGMNALPLAATATPATSAAWLERAWQRLGWAAGATSAASAPSSLRGSLRPGDMVAVVLLSGDAELAVGGTVTAVHGDTVWAFGHPFLGAGGLRLPLARARVIGVLPSMVSSFKFFAVGREIGLVDQDRARGIRGRLGEEAETVPIEVRAAGRNYRFRAAPHPVLLPLLAGYVTSASYGAHGRTFGETTLGCTLRVSFEGGSQGRIAAVFAGSDAPSQAAAMVGSVTAYLMATPFPHPAVRRIGVDLEAAEGLKVARLTGAWPRQQEVQPGEKLAVQVRLEPFGGTAVVRTLEVPVPRSLAAGRVDLIVADGAAWTQYVLEQWPLSPARFADELELLERYLPANVLVAALEAAGDAAAIPGGTLAAPPSQILLWRRTRGSAVKPVRRLVSARTTVRVPWAVRGAVRIPLHVAAGGNAETGTRRRGGDR